MDEEVIGLSTSVVVSFCALRSPLLSLNFLEKMVLGVPTDLLQLLPFRRYRTAKKGPMSEVLNFKSYFNGLQFNIGPYAYFFFSKWTERKPCTSNRMSIGQLLVCIFVYFSGFYFVFCIIWSILSIYFDMYTS